LQIHDNTVTRRTGAVVFRLQFADGETPAVSIDRNHYGGAREAFAIIDDGSADGDAGPVPETTMTFARWRTETGFDASSSLF
jgi:hypothetical protein